MYKDFLDTDFNDAFMLDQMAESDTWQVSEMDYSSATGTKVTNYRMIPVLRWNTSDFFDSQPQKASYNNCTCCTKLTWWDKVTNWGAPNYMHQSVNCKDYKTYEQDCGHFCQTKGMEEG